MTASQADNIETGGAFTRVAAAIGAAAVVLATLAIMAWWNARTTPVFASRPHTVLGFAAQAARMPPYVRDKDAPRSSPSVRAAVWGARIFGGGYPALMAGQLAWLGLAMGFTAWLAGRIGGAGAALTAAACGAAMPYWWMCGLAFDDHAANLAFVAAIQWGAWAAFYRGSRIGAAVAATAGVLLVRNAFVPSTALLAMASPVFAFVGASIDVGRESRFRSAPGLAALRRLVKGREPFVLLVGAGLAATAAWLARFVAVDWAYYARETSNSRLAEITLGDRSASTVLYVLQGFRAELGPVLFVASALATWALFRRRHEHRWFLTLWWLGPLAVLSVLTKKNSYYAYYAWTAMPAAIGVGLSQIRSRPARIAACAAAGVGAWVLCVSWFTGAAGFQPWPESLLRHFQETPTVRPGPPRVVSEYPAEEARTLADATALARPDPCPRVVVAFPDRLTRHSANELMYYLGENDPRIVWYEWSYAHWPPVADEAPLFVDWRNGEEMGDATERLRSLWREDARSASPGFLPVRGPADRLDRLELRLVAETPAWVLYALADAPPVVSCPDNPIGSKREEGRP